MTRLFARVRFQEKLYTTVGGYISPSLTGLRTGEVNGPLLGTGGSFFHIAASSLCRGFAFANRAASVSRAVISSDFSSSCTMGLERKALRCCECAGKYEKMEDALLQESQKVDQSFKFQASEFKIQNTKVRYMEQK